MDLKQVSELCKDTVRLQVVDARGLPVREVLSNRQNIGEAITVLVTRYQHDAAGNLSSVSDPRRFAAQQNDPQHPASIQYFHDLAGQPLGEESQDSGRKLTLWGSGQRQIFQWSGTQLERQRRFLYDHAQRSQTCYETAHRLTQTEQVTDRWIYGEQQESATALNLNGRCIRHYDSGGVKHTASYSILGNLLQETRQLCKDDEQQPDWQGEEETWEAQLDNTRYVTRYAHNALSELCAMTDASGNLRNQSYNVLGQLSQQTLTPVNGTELTLREEMTYNTFGQVTQEQFANGVFARYQYAGESGQLHALTRRRTPQEGRNPRLQEIYYQRDLQGNVLEINNYALEDHYFQNAKIAAVARYGYNACYQLTEANGRESINNTQPIIPMLDDPNALRNYCRRYQYDLAGNILQYQHSTTHTQPFYVSAHSNRSLPALTGIPEDVERFFDPCGNMTQDGNGRLFHWDVRNRLQYVTLLARPGDAENDRESYQYAADGMRLRKVTRRVTHTGEQEVMKKEEVIYLPGLTIRRTTYGSVLAQSSDEVRYELGPHVQLSYQHWHSQARNPPVDQWYYTMRDQVGSHQMTLDAAGDVVNFAEFMPFGETALWSVRSENEAASYYYRYAGKELDASGCYYYGYRYYAAWANRWISPDPAGIIDGVNPYLMVRNNPVTLSDNLGLVGYQRFDRSPGIVTQLRQGMNRLFSHLGSRGGGYQRFSNTTEDLLPQPTQTSIKGPSLGITRSDIADASNAGLKNAIKERQVTLGGQVLRNINELDTMVPGRNTANVVKTLVDPGMVALARTEIRNQLHRGGITSAAPGKLGSISYNVRVKEAGLFWQNPQVSVDYTLKENVVKYMHFEQDPDGTTFDFPQGGADETISFTLTYHPESTEQSMIKFTHGSDFNIDGDIDYQLAYRSGNSGSMGYQMPPTMMLYYMLFIGYEKRSQF